MRRGSPVVAHQSLSDLWAAVHARRRSRERWCAWAVVVGLPLALGLLLHLNW